MELPIFVPVVPLERNSPVWNRDKGEIRVYLLCRALSERGSCVGLLCWRLCKWLLCKEVGDVLLVGVRGGNVVVLIVVVDNMVVRVVVEVVVVVIVVVVVVQTLVVLFRW